MRLPSLNLKFLYYLISFNEPIFHNGLIDRWLQLLTLSELVVIRTEAHLLGSRLLHIGPCPFFNGIICQNVIKSGGLQRLIT